MMYGSRGEEKKKKSWFSGIIIKKASPGPPSPVSPRTLYGVKRPSCVSLEGHRNRGPVLPSEPGPGARSDLRPADGQPPAAGCNPEAPAPPPPPAPAEDLLPVGKLASDATGFN